MYYLIVSEGGREHVLCSGRRADLEALARQLRAEKLFRYVRVDARAPAENGRPPPRKGPGEGQGSGGPAEGRAPA